MFEYLKDFRAVLVTGPQRSGTRICTQMIAQDTGLRYFDEKQIHIDSLYRLHDAVSLGGVIQCPALCRFVHYFALSDQIAVVLMRRAIEDIIASQQRIGWHWEAVERVYYGQSHDPISVIKYRAWEWQKQYIKHPFEVQYESLADHPLWVPKEQRAEFAHDQTQ